MNKYIQIKSRPLRVNIQMFAKITPMFLRGLWYKLWLHKSNGIILIGNHVAIHNPQYIHINNFFVAEDNCEIQGLSKYGITIGRHVTVGRYAMIRPSGYYGREIGEGLRVGDDSNIGPYSYIGCSGFIEIGKEVLMGPRVNLLAENHIFERADKTIRSQGVKREKIHIQDNCWLGGGCTILAGIEVGYGSVVAAGAVVTKNVPPYSIVAGVPAKIIRSRKASEINQLDIL
jgi:acetyltransferase-like isoleucine patch superfamily enzyme